MRSAFSLVELSIVLVILGLLTGGILAGQSLIRAAELRAVGTEYNRFQAAFMTFRDKYFEIPGDSANATKFFGRMTTDSACWFSPGTTVQSPGACNGTGDGMVGAAFGGTGNIEESFQVWRHLMAAGLIEGNYNGRYISSSGNCDANNCPNAKLAGGAQWALWHRASPWNATQINPYLSIGKSLSTGVTVPGSVGGIMSAEEVRNIDTKMDDGKPGIGAVHVRSTYLECSDGTGSAAEYRLSQRDNTCYIEFIVKL